MVDNDAVIITDNQQSFYFNVETSTRAQKCIIICYQKYLTEFVVCGKLLTLLESTL